MNVWRRWALLAALVDFGCQADTVADPNGTIVIEPIEVQSVDVTVGVTQPALVTSRVSGTLGGGCDYLHSIEQQREGAVVTIEIKRTRFTEGPCTTILKSFNEDLGLGAFTAGEYSLRVNGVSRTFRVS
jgi:hypothetical protein